MNFLKKIKDNSSQKLSIKNIFYYNPFVLLFSFFCAVIIWFVLAGSNSLDRPIAVEVPIEIQLSDLAQQEGIRIFSQSAETADVSISGSNVVINKITADNLSVVAELSPILQKISGNTMVTETLVLYASKNANDFSDYQVVDVDPVEVTVVYDRYKEITYDISSDLSYATTEDYYVETPVLSTSQVVISGPESSLNKIAEVVVNHDSDDFVTTSQTFLLDILLYDESGNILNPDDLYLELSIEQVEVSITVYSKQTVTLDVTVLNMPEGFSSSRISIEPTTIDIAGDYDIVSQYSTLVLDNAIDFNSLDTSSNVFTMNITMPDSVRNLTGTSTATVTVNLNGFAETEVTTTNINIINVPDNKVVTLVDGSLTVDIVGTTAQANNLTSDSVFVTVDMANSTDKNGNIQVNATVSLTDVSSCWVLGEYTIVVNVADVVDEE